MEQASPQSRGAGRRFQAMRLLGAGVGVHTAHEGGIAFVKEEVTFLVHTAWPLTSRSEINSGSHRFRWEKEPTEMGEGTN